MRLGVAVIGSLLLLAVGSPVAAGEAYEVRREGEARAGWFDFESDVNGSISASVSESTSGGEDDRAPSESTTMKACADVSSGTAFDSGCGEVTVSVDPLLNEATVQGTIESQCWGCGGSFTSTASTITVDLNWQGEKLYRLRTNPDGTSAEADPQRESGEARVVLEVVMGRDAVATGTLESAELGDAADGPSSSADIEQTVRTCAHVVTPDRFAFCGTGFFFPGGAA